MAHRDDEIQKVERALIESYRSRSDLQFRAADVTQGVMREIRQKRESGRWDPSVVLDQLVWRTATIAAAVVLAVMVVTVGLIRTTHGESEGLLAEEFESVPLYGDY